MVVEWFTRLPAVRDVRYAREELHGYAERLAQITPECRALLKEAAELNLTLNQVIAHLKSL